MGTCNASELDRVGKLGHDGFVFCFRSKKRKGEDKVKLLTPPLTTELRDEKSTVPSAAKTKIKKTMGLFKKRKAMRLLAPKSKS